VHARTLAALVCLSISWPALAGDHSHFTARADGHAPIGVMGDHLHEAGELMLSYRFAHMQMGGNRDGRDRLSTSEVLGQGYAATPTDMEMQMHMLGVMFAPTDWLTLMTMVPFVELSMDHVTGMGAFETKASNIGDIKLSGLLKLWSDANHSFHFNAGVSLPSGSIHERDTALTPMGARRLRLPYPMQTGSGSVDVMPGVTYVGHSERLSWGAQALGTIRTHDNDNDYRLGNRTDLTAWVASRWSDSLSTSLRVAWADWGNYSGSDDRLNPALIPTADPDRRAGERLEVLPGVNLNLPLGPLGTHRLALEFAIPVFQRLDGPQLETDWRVIVGWQKAFAFLAK
jgi:hypothetical protein